MSFVACMQQSDSKTQGNHPHFLQKIDDWRSMAMALGLAWLVSPFSWLQWAGQEQQEEEGGGGWPRVRLG